MLLQKTSVVNDSLLTKYKILIAYDGTRYNGWQIQKNASSIQALIQNALKIILRLETKVVGAGRTDQGVHALGQCAHFLAPNHLDLEKLLHSLNGILPKDIRILSISSISEEFHARYSALGKFYCYHLHVGKAHNPFKRLYSYHYPYPLDLHLIQEASCFFVGERDFTSFSNESHYHFSSKGAIRILHRLSIGIREEEILFEFEGNGFLYKMVRNIVGALLEVGRGKIGLDSIPQIFLAKDRRAAPAAAPPQGLFLVKVHYPKCFL